MDNEKVKGIFWKSYNCTAFTAFLDGVEKKRIS